MTGISCDKPIGMKTILFTLLAAWVLSSSVFAHAADAVPGNEPPEYLRIHSSPKDRALKKRGEKVTEVKEDLVRRTVQAHGGVYRRVGQDVFLELNGKIYTDFTLRIVDGQYLVIESPEKIFKLKIISE